MRTFRPNPRTLRHADADAVRDITLEALCKLQEDLVKSMPLGEELNERIRLIHIAIEETHNR